MSGATVSQGAGSTAAPELRRVCAGPSPACGPHSASAPGDGAGGCGWPKQREGFRCLKPKQNRRSRSHNPGALEPRAERRATPGIAPRSPGEDPAFRGSTLQYTLVSDFPAGAGTARHATAFAGCPFRVWPYASCGLSWRWGEDVRSPGIRGWRRLGSETPGPGGGGGRASPPLSLPGLCSAGPREPLSGGLGGAARPLPRSKEHKGKPL